MSNSEILAINTWLKDSFGHTIDGKAIFRIVWSTGLTVKALVDGDVFSGPIFLRHEKSVREIPKYWYCKDRWVLEKLCFIGDNPEIDAEHNFSYEPLFVFQTSKGEFLPVNRRVLSVIMKFTLDPPKQTLSDLVAEDDKKLAGEIDYFEQIIGQEQRPFHAMDLVE